MDRHLKYLQLYRNARTHYRYRYPRPYSTKLNDAGVTKSLTDNGVEYKEIYAIGIPDGVSPITNVTLVPADTIRRLVIYSDSLLSEDELQVLDNSYKHDPYPILYFDAPINVSPLANGSVPVSNFLLTQDESSDGGYDLIPSTLSRFIEYRYFDRRHQPANILFDSRSGTVFRFVPPDRSTLVIVMPKNFVRTSLYTGYFLYQDNLIINVYSKYLLSCETTGRDHRLYSVISTENPKYMALFKHIFAKLGMHRISSLNSDQIYAYDRYMTVVIGNIANISLPS